MALRSEHMKVKDLSAIIISSILLIAIALSAWSIHGEKWKLFGEGERNAYTANCREFKNSAGSLIKSILMDINTAVKDPPYEPRIEDRGRKWIFFHKDPRGANIQISYHMDKLPACGVYRESQEKGKRSIQFFPLNAEYIIIRKTDENTWKLFLFREVHTSYGFMGNDFLEYNFTLARNK
jgi:hypothetical protein